jgi:protoporphyrinogen oxidase
MAASSHTPVAVLGAGLTGMSAAHHLREAGVECRIFERAARAGGHAVTTEERGWRFDRTGHLLHVKDDDTLALVLRWLGPEHRWIQRKSAVFSHGVYTRYPFQANVYGLPPQVAYECVMGFLEAHGRPPPPRIHDFEQFCLAHFGKGISDHFMIPYNERQLGVHPREITAAWCQRFVPIPSVEDVIAGAVGLGGRELGYNVRFLYPRLGIGQLSEAMAAGLAAAGAPVELERAPTAIDTRRRELVIGDEVIRWDTLVSTVPVPVLVGLAGDAPLEVREAAARLRCTHLYYLDVALRRPCRQPYHWVYVPEAKYPFYRVGCYTHFSESMAPPGQAGLYVELVDRSEPDLPTILREVVRGLSEMDLVGGEDDVVFARLRRIEHAYVVFDHACYAALDVVRAFLAERGIVSTGRYGAWNYSSMGDALTMGRDAAREAKALLGQGPS